MPKDEDWAKYMKEGMEVRLAMGHMTTLEDSSVASLHSCCVGSIHDVKPEAQHRGAAYAWQRDSSFWPSPPVGDGVLRAVQVSLLKWNGRVISVDVPNTVELEVVQTDPGVKGNTASGARLPSNPCPDIGSYRRFRMWPQICVVILASGLHTMTQSAPWCLRDVVQGVLSPASTLPPRTARCERPMSSSLHLRCRTVHLRRLRPQRTCGCEVR